MMEQTDSRRIFLKGLYDGIPIAIGYFAVSFSLGITARESGFTAFQGFIASLTTLASAGEYIGFTLFAAGATLTELVIMTIITNMRYVLMGFALNQKLPAGMGMGWRLLTGLTITDEIFGISVARPGYLNPLYPLGALCISAPSWALGTAFGIVMGRVLPDAAVSALGVALFGMFLAVIIPAGKKDPVIGIVVLVSFAASLGTRFLPYINRLSQGSRTILLTLAISTAAAILVPVKQQDGEAER